MREYVPSHNCSTGTPPGVIPRFIYKLPCIAFLYKSLLANGKVAPFFLLEATCNALDVIESSGDKASQHHNELVKMQYALEHTHFMFLGS